MRNRARIGFGLAASVAMVCVVVGCRKAQERPSGDKPAASKAAPDTGDQPLALIGQLGGPASAVAVDGHFAYVAIGQRLVVVDTAPEEGPVLVGETPMLSAEIQAVDAD